MASEVFFDNPPMLNGSEEEQLRTLQRYLNTMSEKLNVALMNISIEQMEPEAKTAIKAVSGNAMTEQANSLKSLIIKTANIVRNEMDVITTRLQGNFDALSDQFGEYERTLTNDITATAEGILQQYRYGERIDSLALETGTFQEKMNYYIYTGLIDDSGLEPQFGIAIGKDVTAYDNDNKPVLNSAAKMATFTETELAFWVGEAKVAYLSNNVMHIPEGQITQYLKMGEHHTWKIMTNGSLALISN